MRSRVPINLLLIAICLLAAADVDARRRRRRRGWGYFELSSGTVGAAVLVDGRKVGEVPLGRVRLRPGRHTVKLIKPGFTQYIDVIRIRRRRTTKIDIDLLPVAGVLEVRANVPKARVFIDGKFVGLTPLRTEAQAGKRAVRVRKAGYHDFITNTKLMAGQAQQISARLAPMAVGTTPYRPAPPPPPKWYEKWYVWAGAAGGLVAVAIAVIVPIAVLSGNPVDEFGAEKNWQTR